MRQPNTKLKGELRKFWGNIQQQPLARELEALPYLNAVIKESLRMSSGVISGLLRIVPEGGANICGTEVPGNVRINM